MQASNVPSGAFNFWGPRPEGSQLNINTQLTSDTQHPVLLFRFSLHQVFPDHSSPRVHHCLSAQDRETVCGGRQTSSTSSVYYHNTTGWG